MILTIKRAIHLFIILLLFAFNGCISKKQISLKQWIDNEKIFQKIIIAENFDDCESIFTLYNKLSIEEFKSKVYTKLAKCSTGNKEKYKYYILKSFESGKHPNRFDTINQTDIYLEIKHQINKLNKDFWKDKDTSYFTELENRVYADRLFNEKSISNPTEINKYLKDSIFNDNSKYLIHISQLSGFPFQPEPKHFNNFRTTINPSILAIHAPIEDKLILLNYAIKGAEIGNISWRVPIGICVTFFTNAPKQKNLHPLWFLYFDKSGYLKKDKSYLQLYSIKKLYNQDMIRKIRIQPSKYNSSDIEIINNQLIQIKKVLLEEFSFDPEYLIISNKPDNNESDYRNIALYNYSLTVIE